MTDRQELHMMLDRVREEDLEEARLLLKDLVESRERPSPGRKMTDEERIQWLNSLPEEDYELSDEENRRIERSRQQIRSGNFHAWEDVAKELEM